MLKDPEASGSASFPAGISMYTSALVGAGARQSTVGWDSSALVEWERRWRLILRPLAGG
jgi:hypothetical protein